MHPECNASLIDMNGPYRTLVHCAANGRNEPTNACTTARSVKLKRGYVVPNFYMSISPKLNKNLRRRCPFPVLSHIVGIGVYNQRAQTEMFSYL